MKNNRLIKFLTNIVKGGLVGIAAVIPGFSGGTIACIIGIYDDLIEAVGGITKHFKKSIVTLLPYLIGILVFALAFIKPITWGVDNYPFVTVSLFAGLLIGGLPSFYTNIKGKGSVKNFSWGIVGALIVLAVVIPSIFSGEHYVSLATPAVWMYFVLILMGIIASAALVVPGISGSMILLIIGFYTPIMDTIKAFLASLGVPLGESSFSSFFDMTVIGKEYILPSLGLLICFGVGVIAGFILISKLMKFLLTKYRDATYFAIFGFILASLVGIYAKGSYYQNLDTLQIVLAIIFLIGGFTLSFVLGKIAEKKVAKENAIEME